MNILNFWMVAFKALSLSTTLTSCSDDDEKKEETEKRQLSHGYDELYHSIE